MNNNQNMIDTFSKDIPLDGQGKLVSSYSSKNEWVNKLKLDTLENGYDSLQIRIWYGYAGMDSNQLVIIRNNKNGWNADLFYLLPVRQTNNDSLLLINYTIQEKRPKSGWTEFIKNLLGLQILTLPDMDKIAPDIVIHDGDGVLVEVSTRSKYRFYQYAVPSLLQKKLPEAKKMEEILKLIETEFDFKRIRQSDEGIDRSLPVVPRKFNLEPIK